MLLLLLLWCADCCCCGVQIVVAVVCRLCEESIDLIKTIYEMKSSNVHFDEFRELLIFDL